MVRQSEHAEFDRKEFLERMATLAAGLAVPPLFAGCDREQAAPSEIASTGLPLRTLGDTGERLPVLGLGGHHVGQAASERDARALVEAAYEEGVRFFDTAEMYQYGGSETWLGAALEGIRDEVFLMTKTYAPEDRSADSARGHLEGSLERLRTETLDLWQLHGAADEADVERAFSEGGAMQYMLEMKEQGVVRFVGVTGHRRPAALRKALEFWDQGWKFDTMQFPLNPVDYHQTSFQRELLPEVLERGIAVLAMKTSAGGKLVQESICPVEECLRYALSLPVSVAIVGMETPEQVRQNAATIRTQGPLGTEEVDELLSRLQPRADLKLEWYKA